MEALASALTSARHDGLRTASPSSPRESNDHGGATAYANWLRGSRLNKKDMVFIFTVDGDDMAKNISTASSRVDCRVRYSFDGERLLGTGGRLRQALPLLGESFLVMYGDSYLQERLR